MINEYWYNTLNNSEKTIYKNMFASFSRMKFDVDCGNVKPQDLPRIYSAVMDDHPEIFYITFNPSASQKVSFFGVSVVFNSASIFSNSEVNRYKSVMDNIAKSIKLKTNGLKTEEEKERVIVDYIIENVTYQIDMKFNQNAGTCLVEGKAQCSGIARAVKYLCDCVGLWCIVVSGEIDDRASGTTGPHAWNIIRVDGKYYHLDATLTLPCNPTKTKPFRYLYYNYSDSEIKVNHVWNTKTPICVDVFAKNNTNQTTTKVITNSSNVLSSLYEVRVGLADTLKNKRETFSFSSNIRCESDEELMKVVNLATSTAIKTSPNKVASARVSVQGGNVIITFSYR